MRILKLYFWLPIFAVLNLGMGLGPGALVHPQDGPDVDLRVRIDARRVEIQAIVNLAFIDEICPQERLNPDFLEPEEIPAFQNALGETFRQSVQLQIDGVARASDELKIEETEWDPGDAEFFPKMGMKAVVKFRVHMVYRLQENPRSVGLTWKLYPRDLAVADLVDQKLTVNAEWSAGAEVRIIELKDSEPEHIWHAQASTFAKPKSRAVVPEPRQMSISLALLGGFVAAGVAILVLLAASNRPSPPVLALGGVGILAAALVIHWGSATDPMAVEPVNEAALQELFAERLEGIYDAFSFRDEADIYDALALSVTDDLVGPIYDQVYRSLVMQEEGGAVGRVKEFTSLAIEVADRHETAAEATILARWQVAGEVFHWGHSHERRNEYHARYGMKWTPRGWLIDSVKTLSQERKEIGSEAPN